MYDHSGIGSLLRSKVFLVLGLWHNFKQASLLVWKKFALDFIGPAYHCLFPGRDMYIQPKLAQITTILTFIRLSYEGWRQELLDLLARKDVPDSSVNHIFNLAMLMEFFIPTVALRRNGTTDGEYNIIFFPSNVAVLFHIVCDRCMIIWFTSSAIWVTMSSSTSDG